MTVEVTRHAEEMLLGSIMLAACFEDGGIEVRGLKECLQLVKPVHFSHSEHARYYKAMQDCNQPDVIGVLNQLSKSQINTGDGAFLIALCQRTPTEFDLMHYANLVVELWEQRTGKSRKRKGISV